MSQKRLQYGVSYTPNDFANTEPGLTIADLRELRTDIHYVRVQWTDLTNQIRYKVLSRNYFLKLVSTSQRPGITCTAATVSVIAGGSCPGFSGIGEWLYVFDLESLRRVTYGPPGHAVVMGFFQEEIPHPERGVEISLCPRTVLAKVVRDAERVGVRFLAGVEHEFVLLSSMSPATAVNSADWTASTKLPAGSTEAAVLQEIADVLQNSQIELQMYHAEAAPGQYEVITGPLPPMEAADAILYTRETIYNVASKHGLRATFVPRVRPGAFTAAHTHLSVHAIRPDGQRLGEQKPYQNASFGQSLNSTERSFLQGILSSLPSLLPLTYPTPFSYDRVQDGMWTGGTHVCWGTDHREAPIRLTGSQGGHHFEVRCVDGTANPYFVLAGLLAAGTEGVKKSMPLAIGDCRKAVVDMSGAERREMGLSNPVKMPRILEEARKAMASSPLVKEVFGEEFIAKHRSVSESLEKHLLTPEGEERITRLVSMTLLTQGQQLGGGSPPRQLPSVAIRVLELVLLCLASDTHSTTIIMMPDEFQETFVGVVAALTVSISLFSRSVLITYITLAVLFLYLPRLAYKSPRQAHTDAWLPVWAIAMAYDSRFPQRLSSSGSTVGEFLVQAFRVPSTIVCPTLPPNAAPNTTVEPIIQPTETDFSFTYVLGTAIGTIVLALIAWGITFMSPLTYQFVLMCCNIPVEYWGEPFLVWLKETGGPNRRKSRADVEAPPVEVPATVEVQQENVIEEPPEGREQAANEERIPEPTS
ncbi:hypothetical protein EIP91_001450 [Steccherinum ochraceum]|uniref:GS catalytic domain-containing protein n=1 Tax=Steccherinum ochraceum TaxID=92696 RepID=A0A4R0RGE3_9APHY|nr:hypothetical protein EIP91_001450 [Steccherinum ochraceum]